MKEEDKIELKSEEFQDILGSVPPWILRWGITLIGIIVVILLVGSAFFKYPDIISSGIVLTGTTPPATVVARSSGKLNELQVTDNQQVNAGDYLAIIQNTACTKDILLLKTYLNEFELADNELPIILPNKSLNVGHLQSLYATFYTTLFEYQEYKRLLYYPQKIEMTRKRIIQYEEQYKNLSRQQKIIDEQAFLTAKQFQRDSLLNAQGLISHEELEKTKNSYLQSILSCENSHSGLNNMQIQIAQLKETLLDTGHQNIEKVNGLHTQLNSLITQLKAEIETWEINYVLTSPIAGNITFTNYWTANQNVTAGEEVFHIIPTGDIEIIGKANLPVARSGKVSIGQQVNIRIDNFPENEYGILRGVVKNISLVPAKNGETINYTVEITLPDKLMTTYEKELPCLPNMTGQADIITEDMSLLERFILPIKKLLKENL